MTPLSSHLPLIHSADSAHGVDISAQRFPALLPACPAGRRSRLELDLNPRLRALVCSGQVAVATCHVPSALNCRAALMSLNIRIAKNVGFWFITCGLF